MSLSCRAERDKTLPALPEAGAYYGKDDVYVTSAPEAPVDNSTLRTILMYGQIPLVGITLALVLLLYDRVGLRGSGVLFFVVYSVTSIALWRFTLLVATGKFLRNKEIGKSYRLEGKRLDRVAQFDNNRLLAAQAIALKHFEVEEAKIAAEKELQELRIQLAEVSGSRASAYAAIENNEIAQRITYKGAVPVEVSEVRTKLVVWLLGSNAGVGGLYGLDGYPDVSKVETDTGEILVQMPWNAGLCKKTSKEWLSILNPPLMEPTFTYEERNKRWSLNLDCYPTTEAMSRAIGEY